MHQVAITGYGCVTAAGTGVPALSDALFSGRSCIRDHNAWLSGPTRIRRSGYAADFDPHRHFTEREIASLDRFAQFALVATSEAIRSAGLHEADLAGEETAVILGTGVGGQGTQEAGSKRIFGDGETRLDPLSIPRLMPSAAVSQVSIKHKVRGPSFTVASACASSSQAIGLGLQMVRSGQVRRAIVGGSEASITFGTVKAWEALRVLAPDLCRPFSASRNGMVLGEGAGVLILERLDDAEVRGAPQRSLLAGYGTTSDGIDMLRPDRSGCANAMRKALFDAGLDPADIDHINAHGTGTIANDATEASAIAEVFGPRGGDIPVTSTKPNHGHCLGAGGAIELIACLEAIHRQSVPECLNYVAEDPSCALHIVTGGPLKTKLRHVLSNSFAFGGINASLIVSKVT